MLHHTCNPSLHSRASAAATAFLHPHSVSVRRSNLLNCLSVTADHAHKWSVRGYMPDDAECGIPAIQVGPRPVCWRLLVSPLHTGEHSIEVPEVGVLGVDGSLLNQGEGRPRLRHSCRSFCLKDLKTIIVWVCWGSDHPDAGPCKALLRLKQGKVAALHIRYRALNLLKQHQNGNKYQQGVLTRE